MNRSFWRLCCAFLLVMVTGVSQSTGAAGGDRVINISSRAYVGTGSDVLIAGFVIGQGASKTVLVRAVGPGLTGFGVNGALADPVLSLKDRDGNTVASNDNWAASDAAVMTQLGAFALTAGSKDAAFVATLQPGTYTAVVSGASNTRGVCLVEVYESEGLSRLINLSTRARVNTDAGILISGVVVAAGGPRHVLIRAVGPTLADFNVANALANPVLTVFGGSNTPIASNDDWSTGDAVALATASTHAGAFALPNGSKDAALLLTLNPGNYTFHVAGVKGTTGVALLEVYDVTPGANTIAPVISLSSPVPSTAAIGSSPARLQFNRSGSVDSAVTVNYSLSGTAQSGTDYTGPTGTVTFPAGVATVSVDVTAAEGPASGSKTVIATLAPSTTGNYVLGVNSAQVTLHYGPGSLFLANLRAPSSAASNAYGTSTLQLTADERYVYVNVGFAGLSSEQTVAYLRLSNAGEEGAQLVRLPNGPVSSRAWQITASGGFSAEDIRAAVKSGKVYLSIETTNFPSGELLGSFLASAGSQLFTAPPAPPAAPTTATTPEEAARFLIQATFGPTKAEIDALVSKSFDIWITEQMAVPASLHRDATVADYTTFNTNENQTRPNGTNRQAGWWKIALTSPDQLRQRVAFALSEILVISDANDSVSNWQEGAAHYYDHLVTDAFGNFRTLLEKVTLSPMMGVYLSHIRNGKATTTTQPDENYAREIMQLFTIGLHQLQPDGTLKLDANGLPTATYDQATISQTAKVFTGWQFHNTAPTAKNFRSGGNLLEHYIEPMTFNPNFHDETAKTIVGGQQLPASQGGAKDLKDALDALFNHPNTGPFISRQLIQRLVTSNPSPGYVYRVAQTFANNGSGTRGDLGAVVRAILTDYEARSPAMSQVQTFGKLKEPVLRLAALLRAFNASAENGRFAITNTAASMAQAPLRSPTVFNFFEPNYVVPGALAQAGLYAPEYQILTDTTAISGPNQLYSYITASRGATTMGLVYTGLPAHTEAGLLVDHLNLVLAGGSMPATYRDRIVSALTSMPASTSANDKYRSAIYLTVATQEAAIQK